MNKEKQRFNLTPKTFIYCPSSNIPSSCNINNNRLIFPASVGNLVLETWSRRIRWGMESDTLLFHWTFKFGSKVVTRATKEHWSVQKKVIIISIIIMIIFFLQRKEKMMLYIAWQTKWYFMFCCNMQDIYMQQKYSVQCTLVTILKEMRKISEKLLHFEIFDIRYCCAIWEEWRRS